MVVVVDVGTVVVVDTTVVVVDVGTVVVVDTTVVDVMSSVPGDDIATAGVFATKNEASSPLIEMAKSEILARRQNRENLTISIGRRPLETSERKARRRRA